MANRKPIITKGRGVDDLAAHLGLHPNTIKAWMNNRGIERCRMLGAKGHYFLAVRPEAADKLVALAKLKQEAKG